MSDQLCTFSITDRLAGWVGVHTLDLGSLQCLVDSSQV